MPDHPNAALIRRSLESFNEGGLEAMAELLADDVKWHEIGGTEPIHGKQALADRYAGDTPPDFEIQADIHDVVANDDHAIALVEATAKRGGRTFKYRTAEIFHIRNGKIAERWAFSDDTAAINEFFS
ncbi:MAG: nuclear transport factor 2 family protein [Chloroflexota bacterium]|nr:nuclear transport factor 2 family protein [Chloroflexota bacterium]